MLSEEKNKSILFICPYPFGVAAGQRLKYEQSLDFLRSEGYSVTIAPFMDLRMWDILYKEGFVLRKVIGTLKGYCRRIIDIYKLPKFDVIYIFMWVTPIGTSFFERVFLFFSKKVVYDIEDNIFVEKANKINPLARFLKGSTKTNLLVQKADHVITSSPYLNDYCKGINDKKSCTYVSSSIEIDRYMPLDRNHSKVTIGWTGTFSSKQYLELLRNVFTELKKLRDFRLVVIGNFEYSFEEMDLEVIQWKKSSEIMDLQKIDIGVYPLPKEDWVLGKSGLKALQYMGMGIPAVATNYGTAKDFIKHGTNGFLADSNEDWIRILMQLIDDKELRTKVGNEARSTIEQHFSVDIIKRQYLEVIEETIR